MKKLSDEELVLLAQNGDSDAELELFSRYKNLVIKISRSFFLLGGDMEDLSQEGMIGLYKAIKNYKPSKNAAFSTFTTLCIKRQLQSAIKKASSLKNMVLSTAVPLAEQSSFDDEEEGASEVIIPSPDPTPEELLITLENIAEMKMQIKQKLSAMELKVLSHYLDGKSYDEIADKTALSKKSIDNALTRIKTKLLFLKEK